MKAAMHALLLGPIVCGSAAAGAQVRPATSAEIDSIQAALMLDEVPEPSRYRVLEVQGAFTEGSGDRPHRLDGWVYFQPRPPQDSVCVMEARFVTGLGTEQGYDWSVERFAYWNWLARSGGECEIEARSEIPGSAVQSDESIPTTTMAYILNNSGQLLASTYSLVESAAGIPEPVRDRVLRYRSDPSYRLERIGLTGQGSPDGGAAYRARYRASPESEELSIIFFVTPSGFVIHGIQ